MTKEHGNTKNTKESIEARLDKTGDCWEWTGSVTTSGYGRVSYKGFEGCVHRYMYEWHVGPIAPGMIILHECDNRRCANPEHLRQGTTADNNKDAWDKGRRLKPTPLVASLTDYQVLCVRALSSMGMSNLKLADMFNVSRRTIWKALSPDHRPWLESVEGISEAGESDSEVIANKLNTISIEAS